MSSYEKNKKQPGFVRDEKFLEHLSNCQLLMGLADFNVSLGTKAILSVSNLM
jgi:hypothetical protein